MVCASFNGESSGSSMSTCFQQKQESMEALTSKIFAKCMNIGYQIMVSVLVIQPYIDPYRTISADKLVSRGLNSRYMTANT